MKKEYEMEVTEVRVQKIDSVMRAKAMASVVLNDAICINDIRVIVDREKGAFIAMPSRKVGEGNFRDIAHPINAEMRQVLEETVLKAYHEAVAQLEVAAE